MDFGWFLNLVLLFSFSKCLEKHYLEDIAAWHFIYYKQQEPYPTQTLLLLY